MLLLAAATVAFATTSPHGADEPLVDAAIRAHVADALGVADHDVEVRSNGVGNAFPCGPAAKITVEAAPGEQYRRYVRFRLTGIDRDERCADLRVRAEVVVWQKVPVVARSVGAGETVAMTTRRVERHTVVGASVDPAGGPFIAVAPMQAGAPVTVSRVRTAPDWKAGSAVTLVAGGNGLVIRTSGRLLMDAKTGDQVRVANPATGAVVVGVIRADGRVEAQGAGQ